MNRVCVKTVVRQVSFILLLLRVVAIVLEHMLAVGHCYTMQCDMTHLGFLAEQCYWRELVAPDCLIRLAYSVI